MLPNLFTLIGTAWDFYKKQPVLNSILLWMMILPIATINVLDTVMEPIDNIDFSPQSGKLLELSVDGTAWHLIPATPQTILFFVVIMVVSSVLVLWGSASILIVGGKLISSKAGRARTSFATVRSQAAKLLVPLVLTGILRSCIALLWSLLLIVPGIIYSIRTSFYQIIIAGEGLAYRDALQHSKKVVKGYTWQTLLYFIGLGIFLYLPASLLGGLIAIIAGAIDPYFLIFADIVNAALNGIATMLYLLCTIMLYSDMQKLPHSSPKS